MTRKRPSKVSSTASATRNLHPSLDFLSGGGEMGEHVRAFDWSTSPLGDPAGWPLSLRTTVGILLNSKYPMFLAWGPELAMIYNDGYLPVFGDKHPAALGQPFAEVWAEIWDDIRPLVYRALAGEPTWSENMQLFMERRGFPEEVYFTFSYSPVRGDDGAIEGMFCACIETTGEVTGERRLKTLRDLAAVTGDGRSVEEASRKSAEVIGANAADAPFSLIYLNQPAGSKARLVACSGCDPGEPFSPELIGLNGSPDPGWPDQPLLPQHADVLHGLDPRLGLPAGPWPEPASTAAILPLARSGQDEQRGYLIVGASPRLPFDEQYQRFFELLANGVASALAGAEAYEAERRRAEKLAELDRAKTAFFSNVSHEFRTPLTLILGPVADALAEDNELPVRLREQLTVVHRNSLRMQKLVNSLLDFSRVEAGRERAAFQPTDLAALTTDLASNFRSACEKASLELRVTSAPLPESAYVDREMWEKIVLNLLSNAFKFTLEGGIDVTLGQRSGNAILEVRDTGVGIPADELPKIFDRFHRVEGGGGRTHEGSGIGLALVRELVRLHGGRIDVESGPGRGTCLTVTVPLGFAHLPPEKVSHDGSSATAGSAAEAFVQEALRWLPDAPGEPETVEPARAATMLAPARGRVLVADDNADMREYLVRLLREHWQVETAADGAEALEGIRRHPPDLVLTDVMMPGLDGFELIRALRTDENTAAIPVIMVSARAGEEARIEGLEAGADDYLVKPFTARELVARVSAHLAFSESARERAELIERERHARKAAEQANRAKDEFLAMLGHELRNPLAPIMTALDLMRLQGDNAFERERAVIERQAKQLVSLVDDLLDVSRIAGGKIELKKEPAAMADIVARGVEMVSPLLEQRRHQLTIDVPAGLSVNGDPARLAQVVSNLVSNAAKYTPADGRIEVAAERRGDQAVLTVRDNGTGIAPELLPRVFDMFSQQHQSIDRSDGGLGLGLSIVQSLVRLHGGEVTAYSEGEGRGSELTVRLPALPALATAPERAPDPARASLPERPAVSAPRRVLIVDDNVDAARSLGEYLQNIGHTVRIAHDGPAALAIAGEFGPDAVLLDIGLPVMDGYDVARRLRQSGEGRGPCLVAVTGYGQSAERERTAAAGFDAHLVKPIDLGELAALLGNLKAPVLQ